MTEALKVIHSVTTSGLLRPLFGHLSTQKQHSERMNLIFLLFYLSASARRRGRYRRVLISAIPT